ncbi:hypothetical protein BS78_03G148100 [Paspalum vaginatum]|nr:hypothetical protein BS78_03G148100 [Paspalum vaginatum]
MSATLTPPLPRPPPPTLRPFRATAAHAPRGAGRPCHRRRLLLPSPGVCHIWMHLPLPNSASLATDEALPDPITSGADPFTSCGSAFVTPAICGDATTARSLCAAVQPAATSAIEQRLGPAAATRLGAETRRGRACRIPSVDPRFDKNEVKLNLGVGAYRIEELQPYVLNEVKKAEKLMLERGENKESSFHKPSKTNQTLKRSTSQKDFFHSRDNSSL